MLVFRGVFGRWRTLVLCMLLSFSQHSAWADIWGWVDAQGTAHFASERVDARYQLYFRDGESFDSRDLADAPGAAGMGARPGVSERMRTFFDVSPAYKAVRHLLRDASELHGIDYALLQALIVTESGFNAAAVSPKGAVGLMQLMPATAQRYGVAGDTRSPLAKRLTDPLTNIGAGSRYLRYLLDLFPGQMELVLAAYNAGEGAVQRAGNRIPNYPETQNYVKTVMQLYRMLQPGGGVGTTTATAGRNAPHRVRMELPPPVASAVPALPVQARAPAVDPSESVVSAE